MKKEVYSKISLVLKANLIDLKWPKKPVSLAKEKWSISQFLNFR